MRNVRRALLLGALAFLLLPVSRLSAQQLPVYGCRAATACAGPRGFYTLRQSAGEGNTLMGVGFSISPGGRLQARLVRPVRTEPGVDWRAIDAAVEIFVSRNTLRAPKASPPAVPAEATEDSAEPSSEP